MASVALFLTNGFEETEALATIDILRRGDLEVTTISITGDKMILGAHNVNVLADKLFEEVVDFENFDCLVLPGGPGTSNYNKHQGLLDIIKKHNDKNKMIAAICAAPMILGGLGILDGKKAICYPGCEDGMGEAKIVDAPVVTDGNIITSKGPGTTIFFGLKIVENLQGAEIAKRVGNDFIAII